MSSGMTAQGATALMSSPAGTRISLLSALPLKTAQITGISRLGSTPVTCSAFSARSSPSTPAVFLVATFVSTATSSSNAAISSIRVRRLVPAIDLSQGARRRAQAKRGL
jgi:hypothetical protein